MNPEISTARKVYRWLWLSPLLTIPTLIFILSYIQPGHQLICGGSYQGCDYGTAFLVDWVCAILGSALWHLIFLGPTLTKPSEFVRWHGRQALLLVGMRTAIPLASLIIGIYIAGYAGAALWVSIPILIVVWLFGTLWGQRQASRGDCTVMRWSGHSALLTLPTEMAFPVATPVEAGPIEPLTAPLKNIQTDSVPSFGGAELPAQDPALSSQIENLLEIIRSSSDQEQRRKALTQLEKLGLVEGMGDAPELVRDTSLPAEAEVRAISSPKKKTGYRVWLIAAGIIVFIILVAIDSSGCSPILRIKDANYYQSAGKCYLSHRQRDKAITAYEKGLELDPDDRILREGLANVYYERGKMYRLLNNYDRAVDDFASALKLNPSDADTYIERGQLYDDKEIYDRAVDDFASALKLNPNDADTHNDLAWILAYKLDTDYERALYHALRSVELAPDCNNQDTLGLVYYKLGRYEDALEHYNLALDFDKPWCAQSYKRRGDVYLATGEDKRAWADYILYLAHIPNAPDREDVMEIIQTLQ